MKSFSYNGKVHADAPNINETLINMAKRKRITAQMVADRAGVSRSAVSRAFTKGSYLEESKRRRILGIAAEIGYQPNALAAGLQGGRSRLVAVIEGDIRNAHDTTLISRLCSALNANGFWPILVSGTPINGYTEALAFPLDALIVRGGSMSKDLVHRCAKLGIPMICYGRPTEELNIDSVHCKNQAGMQLATELLVSKGRQKFGFLGGPDQFYSSMKRRKGVLNALENAGLDLQAEAASDFSVDGGFTAAKTLLTGNGHIDALVCANDAMAIGALGAARALGIAIPDALSVVGFDDADMADWQITKLTTVRNPLETTVQEVLNLLVDRINNPDRECRTIRVEPQLVIRGTH